MEIHGVADLDRTIRLRFALTHTGEVDVREAFQEYTERGTTLTRPFEATQVRPMVYRVTEVRIFNSGWSFLASKVPSDTPYLSPWWTNLSEIWHNFDLTRVTKDITVLA